MSSTGQINRHGFYLAPSSGRSRIIQNAPSQQFVNTGTSVDTRIIRKYFSSISPCNEVGALGYLYTSPISGAVRNLIAIRFLTVQMDFSPTGTLLSENTAFILLEGGIQARETSQQTASGEYYTAKFIFPSCVSPEEPSRQFEYRFPENYFQAVEHSTSIDKIKISILKEDSTSGHLVPMTNVNYSNLELELYLGLSQFQTY